jgi:hypothetical protein
MAPNNQCIGAVSPKTGLVHVQKLILDPTGARTPTSLSSISMPEEYNVYRYWTLLTVLSAWLPVVRVIFDYFFFVSGAYFIDTQ